jgi:hypothetical protein
MLTKRDFKIAAKVAAEYDSPLVVDAFVSFLRKTNPHFKPLLFRYEVIRLTRKSNDLEFMSFDKFKDDYTKGKESDYPSCDPYHEHEKDK